MKTLILKNSEWLRGDKASDGSGLAVSRGVEGKLTLVGHCCLGIMCRDLCGIDPLALNGSRLLFVSQHTKQR